MTNARKLLAAAGASIAGLAVFGTLAMPALAGPAKAAGTKAAKQTTSAAPTTAPSVAPSTAPAPEPVVEVTAPLEASVIAAPNATVAPTTTTTATPTTTTVAAPVTIATPVAPVSATVDAALPEGPSGMLIGTRSWGAVGDAVNQPAMNAWQGKTSAVVQTYVRSDLGPVKVTDLLNGIWSQGSVPAISYDLQVTNAQVLAGTIDPNLELVTQAVKVWLSGPDGVYGNGDDRRAYFRPAWEANGTWYRWSPCSNGTAAEYQAMWKYLYGKFAALGVDNTRLAWIFSVNSTDTRPECAMELLYPGDAYVDWTGIDGYTYTVTKSAYGVFNPMLVRLRALAPTKPVSINEWGADSLASVGKSAWIDGYFLVAHGLGVKMSIVFNVDKEKDWAVFGGTGGDETFAHGGQSYRAYGAYRRNVGDSRVVGANPTSPRLLTDNQFLGR